MIDELLNVIPDSAAIIIIYFLRQKITVWGFAFNSCEFFYWETSNVEFSEKISLVFFYRTAL